MNKNINTIILAILALAVGGLYILHFSKNDTPKVIEKENKYIPKEVVFINTDTFFENYKGYQKMKREIESSQKSTEKRLQNKMKAIENEYMKLMKDAQAGKVTMQQAQQKEKSLVSRKNALEKEFQNSQKSLIKKTDNKTKKLYKKLNEYFVQNKSKYNVDFVMGYQTNGQLIYYNPDNDITNKVVEDLNQMK